MFVLRNQARRSPPPRPSSPPRPLQPHAFLLPPRVCCSWTAGHNAFDDMFVLTISWGKVEGVYGLVAEWENLETITEGPMPCPRSRQVGSGIGDRVSVGVIVSVRVGLRELE